MEKWCISGALCVLVAVAALVAGCTGTGGAVQDRTPPVPQEMTTADLAAFVQNASAYAESVGQEAALAAFAKKDGRFSEGDLYVYAYDYNGTLLAHPYSPGFVGTNQMNGTDSRGLPVNRIGAFTASTGGGFIIHLYPAPESETIDAGAPDTYVPKLTYVAPAGETWWIGSGTYLSDLAGEGTSDAVVAMIDLVERGAAYGRDNGAEVAYAEISNPSGRFVDAEGHYLYAYDYNGTLLAHPYLGEKIGSSLIERRGPFGMANIRSLTETARDGGGFIVFVWPNPAQENREELKIGYVLPVDETWWVGSGVYLSEITGTDASFPAVR